MWGTVNGRCLESPYKNTWYHDSQDPRWPPTFPISCYPHICVVSSHAGPRSVYVASRTRQKQKSLLGLGYKRYIAASMWASLSLSLSVPPLPPWVDLGLLNSSVGRQNIMRQHLNILAKNYFQPKTLAAVKLSTKGEARIKIFSDIHRLKKFISDGPLSQELLAACAWPTQGTKSWQTEPRGWGNRVPSTGEKWGEPQDVGHSVGQDWVVWEHRGLQESFSSGEGSGWIKGLYANLH